MRDEDPTSEEVLFFDALSKRIAGLQDWYHRDSDGALWMIASIDVAPDGTRITDTWRCDFDGVRLLGGRSPGFLNWDDGVRAIAAGVDVDGVEGLKVEISDPRQAAEVAANWFEARISSERHKP